MIMKQLFIYLMISASFLCVSCSDFLDSENLVKKDNTNFPMTSDDAMQSLYGAYSKLITFDANNHPFLVGEMMSDDRLGGGGQNDRKPQALNVFRATTQDELADSWGNYYRGIFRCNMLLSTLDQVPSWESETQKNRIKGEAHFLRAYYYFNMARTWGTVPLVITTEPQNNPKATPEELYGQIFLDLKTAIECLPATSLAPSELGRATKWAAESMMARVYLFYDGYYNGNTRQGVTLADGSNLAEVDVISYLEDCIHNSGHKLADDFRNLWPYSIDIPEASYQWAKDNQLCWLKEEGENKETIFALKHSTLGGWQTANSDKYSNQVDIYMGIRNQSLVPFGKGWGFGPVSPKLWNEWPDNDIRKKGSICDVNDPEEGLEDYQWGGDMQWQETGFWNKKYMPINVKRTKEDGSVEICNYSCVLYGRTPDFSQDNTQDIVILRFADVLLMHSELTRTVDGINQVRARVDLEPISSYSDEALRQERRYELAFESCRYYDLLRWYGKEAGAVIKKNLDGAKIYNMGQPTTINADRGNGYFDKIDQRVRDTGGFLQIPNEEIQKSEGVLIQNPGWEGADAVF